jgi:AraC-like DNA-binding protein
MLERGYTESSSPQHPQRHASFCWVVAGSFEQRHGGSSFACDPGSLLFYPANVEHREVFVRPGARCLIFELEEAWLAARQVALPAAPRVGGRDALSLLARRAYAEYQRGDAVTALAVEGILLELLAALRRAPEGAAPDRLRRADEFVRAHFRETIGLSAVSAAAGLRPTHLATAFRRRYGRSVGELVRELRVEWVAMELLRSRRPLAELALEAGFADQSHLTRVFRRLTGTTPGRFRSG